MGEESRSQLRDREKKPACVRRRLETPGRDPVRKENKTRVRSTHSVGLRLCANMQILQFSLTCSLLSRGRLSHTIGVLGNDGHQVVCSWPQVSCCEGPLTGRDSFLQRHKGHCCKHTSLKQVVTKWTTQLRGSTMIFCLHHVCQASPKGILLSSLPSFNLYSTWRRPTHQTCLYSAWRRINFDCGKAPNIYVSCKCAANLTQFCCDWLTQARERHILDHVAAHGAPCRTPTERQRIRRLRCKLNVGRTRKRLWEERRGDDVRRLNAGAEFRHEYLWYAPYM